MKSFRDKLRSVAARIEEAVDLVRLYFVLYHVRFMVWRIRRIQRRTNNIISASARQGV